MYAFPHTGPGLGLLLGDEEVEALFDIDSMLHWMVDFELALTTALYEYDLISGDVHDRTIECLETLSLDIDKLDEAGARDGVIVPELVRQVREVLPPDCRKPFHCGATSQDLIDSALSIALREFNEIVRDRLKDLEQSIELLIYEVGEQPITARTRMQAAGTIMASDRLDSWQRSITEQIEEAENWQSSIAVLEFSGPLGTKRSESIPDWRGVSMILAQELRLNQTFGSRHTDRSRIAFYASWLSVVAGSIGKIGQDFCLMAQSREIQFTGGGKSSSIAGKQNPVQAEVLVSLARFCAVLVSGMHHSLVHEQERSGAAWTLEWMVLPQICVALGASLRTADSLIASIVGFAPEST